MQDYKEKIEELIKDRVNKNKVLSKAITDISLDEEGGQMYLNYNSLRIILHSNIFVYEEAGEDSAMYVCITIEYKGKYLFNDERIRL